MAGRIVLLGGPGAGKGTQARKIVKREAIPHISTGDIFRKHMEEETEIGQQIGEYMDSGRLVPDELTCRIVAERLAEPDCVAGYVLDGFPRSVPQAEELSRILAESGGQLDIAIELQLGDDAIVERLTARRTCPNCGKIYNLVYSPPKQDGECDKCPGTELQHRSDDQEETIRERLKVYHEQTEPIIAFYKDAGCHHAVGVNGLSPDEVAREVETLLSAHGAMG